MVAKTLKKMLNDKSIKYMTISHSPAYTVQEVSESAHYSSQKMAKTVIVNVDGDLVLAVIPGNKKINLEALRQLSSAREVTIASEEEFKKKFTDCELGAMPPFGHLYNMKVFVDESLKKEKEIGFNAGNHSEIITMKYQDFEALEKPSHGNFT